MRVIVYPDSRLREVAKKVETFDDELRNTVVQMQQVMKRHSGAGLAATQVGICKRLFVYTQEDGQESCMINPEIVDSSGQQSFKEGCLSFPGIYIEAERCANITVKFQDIEGEFQEAEFSGFLAQCIQHEIDHLNGLLYTRFLSKIKQDIVKRKLKKVKKSHDRKVKKFQDLAKQIGVKDL